MDQLCTPVLRSKSPGSFVSQGTSCRDEMETENLLPGLLDVNNNDPLLRESPNVITHPSVVSVQTQTSDTDLEEPPRKKQRVEEPCQISAALAEIASATIEGFKKNVEAINSNTRAIRCQEKVQQNIVNEQARIERIITLTERSKQKESTSNTENKNYLQQRKGK